MNFGRLKNGLFITGGEKKSTMKIFLHGALGKPLEKDNANKLCQIISDNKFVRKSYENVTEPTDMSSMEQLYMRELKSHIISDLSGFPLDVPNPLFGKTPSKMLYTLLGEMDCGLSGDLTFILEDGGTALSLYDANYGAISKEQVFAILCLIEIENGGFFEIPYDTPAIVSAFLHKKMSGNLRKGYENPLWQRDGLQIALKIINHLVKANVSIFELLKKIPEFSTTKRVIYSENQTFDNEFFKSNIMKFSNVSENDDEQKTFLFKSSLIQGKTLLTTKNGVVSLTPFKDGRALSLVAESSKAEVASEICGDLEKSIRRLISQESDKIHEDHNNKTVF